ncbi:MAG: tRNA (adenosine(37)-N6)-threonylcarbamoyltransferase complex ATPase subunit type 1 TsaE [Planctomycetota bacterium]
MVRELHLRSRSAAATEAVGEALGRALEPGALVTLDGELGSGKTCFVRGLARGLDVEDRVSSPTYALLQTYTGRMPLAHLDAWMEGRERAFLADGGLEALPADGVTVIEWADRIAELLPPERLALRLEHAGPETRELVLRVAGASERTAALAGALTELGRRARALHGDLEVVDRG